MADTRRTRFVAAGPAHPWCHHPPEERQRVFRHDATHFRDRQLCGLCGEVLYRLGPA